MAFSQAQLDALDAAIASGTLRVTYDGKTVEYRSLAELMRARALVAGSVRNSRSGRRFAFYRSGL